MSGYIILSVVAIILFTGDVGVQSQCAAADSLLEAKLYQDAQVAYADVLKNDSLNASQRTCALAGIKDLQHAQSEELYKLGKTYEEQGQLNNARDSYIGALKIDPNQTDARSALVLINPFAEVYTLADNGLYTEAVAKFKKVMETNPNISVPNDMKYLFGGNISSWRSLKFQFEPWIRPVIEILIVILVIVLAAFAFRFRIYPWLKGFSKLQLDIVDFDKGNSGLEICTGVKALVEESYNKLGEGSPRIHLVDKPLEKLEIPVDIKGVPYLKTVSALVEWVFPQNVITLSGYLQKAEKSGAGMTLTLVKNRTGEIIDSHTIWQKDFDLIMTRQKAPDPAMTQQKDSGSESAMMYHHLAKLAAIWVFFHLNKLNNELNTKSLFGTENWLSFAYLRAGAFWSMNGEKIKARQLFVEAMTQDMDNRNIWFNLGCLDIEMKNFDHAIERLSWARDLSEPRYPSKSRDYVWYLATYQLASAYHYKSILSKKADYLSNAKTESDNLVNEIDVAIDKLKSSMEEKEKRMKQFLQSFSPNAKIMNASIMADQGNLAVANKIVNDIKSKNAKYPYRVHYNFACYYSIVYNRTKSTDDYNQALDHLEYALERGGDIINWAQEDLSLEGIRKDQKAFDNIINKYIDPAKRVLPTLLSQKAAR